MQIGRISAEWTVVILELGGGALSSRTARRSASSGSREEVRDLGAVVSRALTREEERSLNSLVGPEAKRGRQRPPAVAFSLRSLFTPHPALPRPPYLPHPK